MTAALSIEDLRKTYRSKDGPLKEALKGVSLSVEPGAFFGLLGPNGAGKSTLINILAGTVTKTSGRVRIAGNDLDTDLRAAKRAIGIVPQELMLDTFFTVRQALEFFAGYYGVPKKARRTDELIAAMGLADKADAPSRSLSGGMRRRLLIAKALVHAPQVLVLDEPTAGVDVELRRSLWQYVRELNRAGTTVLLTTHYLEEAEELCDRIAIIHHGAIVADERKDALMRHLDSKELILTLAAPLAAVPESLHDLQASLRSDGRLVVQYAPSALPVEQLLARIRTAGLQIADLSTRERDLEDVFLALTSSRTA